MPNYEITAHIIAHGVYNAATPLEAFEKFARAHGYQSLEEAAEFQNLTVAQYIARSNFKVE